MLGLAFRSDVSAFNAAIGALIDELSQLAATTSGNRDVVNRQYEGRPHKNREQNLERHSRVGRDRSKYSAGPWIERPIRGAGFKSPQRYHRRNAPPTATEEVNVLSSDMATLPGGEWTTASIDRVTARAAAAGRIAGFAVIEST